MTIQKRLKLNRKNYNTAIPLLEAEYERLNRLIEDAQPPEYCHVIDYTVETRNGNELYALYTGDVPPKLLLDRGDFYAITDDKCKNNFEFDWRSDAKELWAYVEE